MMADIEKKRVQNFKTPLHMEEGQFSLTAYKISNLFNDIFPFKANAIVSKEN